MIQFVEWIELGSWSEVKGKSDRPVKLLEEVSDLLKLVESSSQPLKESSKKLRLKIAHYIDQGFI